VGLNSGLISWATWLTNRHNNIGPYGIKYKTSSLPYGDKNILSCIYCLKNYIKSISKLSYKYIYFIFILFFQSNIFYFFCIFFINTNQRLDLEIN
jgi:hypothetical protein